ncbi:MAG: prepilin-type N-terminal cleavage/methylation domain-containing protein [bacterium]
MTETTTTIAKERARRHRRAFSIIEVVVVCAILAVIAAAIVPKMISVRSHREEKAIVAIEDLLRMYAFRNSAGVQQVGLYYDPSVQELSLWIYDLNPENPEGSRVWQPDRLSNAVELPEGMTIDRASADEAEMPQSDPWNIPTHPDGSRPRITLDVIGVDKQLTITLENYSSTPLRSDDPWGVARAPVDLDAQGSTMEVW